MDHGTAVVTLILRHCSTAANVANRAFEKEEKKI